MKVLGNILWHIPFLGFVTAILYWLLGGLLTITVIGAPIGLGLIEYSKFLLWPFGKAMVNKKELNMKQNKAWGTYSTIVRIIYFPFGFILAIVTIFQIVGLFITLFGIPMAIILAKSLSTIFNPVNKKCVSDAMVNELAQRKAVKELDALKNA